MTGRRNRIPNHCKSQRNRKHALRLHPFGNSGTLDRLLSNPRQGTKERWEGEKSSSQGKTYNSFFPPFKNPSHLIVTGLVHKLNTVRPSRSSSMGAIHTLQPPTVRLTSAHYSWEYVLSKLLGFSHLHVPTLVSCSSIKQPGKTKGSPLNSSIPLQHYHMTCVFSFYHQKNQRQVSKNLYTNIPSKITH